MKKLISLLLVLLLFFSTSVKAQNIILEINKKDYTKCSSPTIIDGRVYVPLRIVSEALNKEVRWDATSMSILINSSIIPIPDKNGIKIYVENKKLDLNANLGRPYLSLEGITYVPLKLVSEALDADIKWINSEKKVIVTTDNSKSNLKNEVFTPIQNSEEIPKIFSESKSSLLNINNYLNKKEKEIENYSKEKGLTFVPFPKNIGVYYYEIGKKYGINGEYALAQAILETGYFQYGHEVKPEQNNFCGLGATGRVNREEDLNKLIFSKIDKENAYLVIGNHGWNFKSVAIGVEAHIQHLYSYATKNPLPSSFILYDGRFNHGNRGKAIYWQDLNGKWAVPGKGYGERIDKIAKEIQIS